MISGSQPPPRRYFYPRPPGGGRPFCYPPQVSATHPFLSTPSGWRATRADSHLSATPMISIHALRVEGDSPSPLSFVTVPISIHALRVEGDWPRSQARSGLLRDFYPRPPGGGRRVQVRVGDNYDIFLSTPSGWRATAVTADDVAVRDISIHALRVEGDPAMQD